jgi:DNA mismatch endonuclease (patch repair protein)
MPDVFAPQKRSSVMSRIRGSGNRDTELRMIKLFREHQITGWRRNSRVYGKPDFVFPRERVAVFVDGCFWHGCPKPKHAPLPKSRAEWWQTKLAGNRRRDRNVTRALRNAGWTVVRVWECDLHPRLWRRIGNRVIPARSKIC